MTTFISSYSGTIEEAMVAKQPTSIYPIIGIVLLFVVILIFLLKARK